VLNDGTLALFEKTESW